MLRLVSRNGGLGKLDILSQFVQCRKADPKCDAASEGYDTPKYWTKGRQADKFNNGRFFR